MHYDAKWKRDEIPKKEERYKKTGKKKVNRRSGIKGALHEVDFILSTNREREGCVLMAMHQPTSRILSYYYYFRCFFFTFRFSTRIVVSLTCIVLYYIKLIMHCAMHTGIVCVCCAHICRHRSHLRCACSFVHTHEIALAHT